MAVLWIILSITCRFYSLVTARRTFRHLTIKNNYSELLSVLLPNIQSALIKHINKLAKVEQQPKKGTPRTFTKNPSSNQGRGEPRKK